MTTCEFGALIGCVLSAWFGVLVGYAMAGVFKGGR